jgi:hypothetical protein
MKLRRITALVIAMAIAFVPLAGANATPVRPTRPVIIQGAGLAGAGVAGASVDPNIDLWPIYSTSSIDNQTSHGLSGAIWPGFLLDAFAWLYGLQPQERAGLGVSESQWPNPPHSSQASSTGFMLKNFADECVAFFGPGPCAQAFGLFGTPPAAAGVSASTSALLDSNGSARGVRFDVPGILEADEAWSRTASTFNAGRTVVESVFTARNVTIGSALHIDLIEARSVARAALNDGSDGSSTLKIVGAKFGDTPVVIDDQGMHASGDSGTDSLNSALAAQGLEVRASQGRETKDASGESVDTATGGLLIRVSRQRVEDTFPPSFIAGKEQACNAAANSPVNQEITRIRFDQPNPLFGRLPVPGMPKRAQLDQSVPPPVSCPFTNRNMGVLLVLGLTNASARLTPLPDLGPFAVPLPGVSVPAVPGYTTPGRPGSAPQIAAAPAPTIIEAPAALASSPRKTGDVARRVRIVYGLIVLVAALGIAGRFALKIASSP